MTLRWIDGFELYATTLGHSVNAAPLLARYPLVTAGQAFTATGRTGANAMRFNQASLLTPTFTSESTWVVGFGFKNFNLPISDTPILAFMDSSTAQIKLVFAGATNVLKVTDGSGTVLGTGTTTILPNSWYFLELKSVINNSTGTVHLKINGTDELNLTGKDTQISGNASANCFTILGTNINGSWIIDDLYILDNQGSANNDFLGDNVVELIVPTGVGADSDWISSTGSNWQSAAAFDGRYVYTNTTNATDTYTFGDLTRVVSNIAGISTYLFGRNSDNTTHTMTRIDYISSTAYTGTTQTISGTGYSAYQQIDETNPGTSSAWTVTDVNNAQFGVKFLS